MSDLDPSITLDDDLIRSVLAQETPTAFEMALLRHIRRLENRLEATLNDLTALHAGKKRRILLDNQDDPPTVLKLTVHVDGEDEIPKTLH